MPFVATIGAVGETQVEQNPRSFESAPRQVGECECGPETSRDCRLRSMGVRLCKARWDVNPEPAWAPIARRE